MPARNACDLAPQPAPCRYSPELIEETKEVWQEFYARVMTDEDAREIIENMIAFMGVIATIAHPPEAEE